MRWGPLALLLSLGACTGASPNPPQQALYKYSDYRQLMYTYSQSSAWRGVPENLQNEMRVCYIDVYYVHLMPSDIRRLDAYARGEASLTGVELDEINKRASEHAGNDADKARLLQETCAATIKKMQSLGSDPLASMPETGVVKHTYPDFYSLMRHLVELSTEDKYPADVRKKLSDCMAWAITKDVPPEKQAEFLDAVDTRAKAEGMALWNELEGHLSGARFKQNVEETCPRLAAQYPEITK